MSTDLDEPNGVLGLTPSRWNRFFPHKEGFTDLDDCLVSRPRPWRLEIWEPMSVNAPGPREALPWCCYIQTVIFYTNPDRWADGRMDEIARIETRLAWDDVVHFAGEDWEVGGGEVKWRNGKWWMHRWARRLNAPQNSVPDKEEG